MIIINLAPGVKMMREGLGVLNFANLARKVENRVAVNVQNIERESS